MARLLRFAAVLFAALAFPAAALAGTATLHPAGFGQQTYAAWKAHEGLPDTAGSDDQALYFQKNTLTDVFAAGVAVFKFKPFAVQDLDGLSFWVGTDGHCGAGAPRFNIVVRPSGGGATQTFFVGCQGMVPTGRTAIAPNGRTFVERAITAPFAAACCGPFPTSGFDVVGLGIVYDEGSEVAQCRSTTPGATVGESCVYLDDIQVSTSDPTFGVKCWTGANDNSNASTGPCPTPVSATAAPLTALLNVAVTGVGVNPLDTDLVDALNYAYPGVTLTDWSLYPDVY